ncbi:MAG: T9SS type A sorting domain-containing protein [Chitinophagales bacterium]
MRKLYTTILISAILSVGNAQQTTTDQDPTADKVAVADATITIYPNPVKSFATLSFTYQNIDKISILNIVGREIKSITPEYGKQEMKISLVDLQPGVYFLAAYYQGSTLITKKFLKED